MNILISGTGGVRTDFVRQFLLRALNKNANATWNIDCFSGRTLPGVTWNTQLNTCNVDKIHYGIAELSNALSTLNYDIILYIMHDATNAEQCANRTWEHLVKSFLIPSQEFTVEQAYQKIETMLQAVTIIETLTPMDKVFYLKYSDMIDSCGSMILEQTLDITFDPYHHSLWQAAIEKSHSPDRVHYQGELFTKDYVRSRVEYYFTKRQESDANKHSKN